MASREAIIDIIYRAYDARGKGDIEGVMAAFHPEALFELKGDKDLLVVAGAVQGHQDVRTAILGLIEAFTFLERDIVDAIVEDDRASIHSRCKIRFVPGDTVFTTDLLDKFRIRDGKIIELVEFADTALIKSLLS